MEQRVKVNARTQKPTRASFHKSRASRTKLYGTGDTHVTTNIVSSGRNWLSHCSDGYIIENPAVLILHKNRRAIAEQFLRYRRWCTLDAACTKNPDSMSFCFPYDLPPLIDVLKDRSVLETLPNVIGTKEGAFPPNESPYTRYDWDDERLHDKLHIITKSYNAREWETFCRSKVVKRPPLAKKTVVALFDEIDRLRNIYSPAWKKQCQKAEKRGWDTDMYPWGCPDDMESRDALVSALASKDWLNFCANWVWYSVGIDPNEHMREAQRIVEQELTDEFINEFMEFYLQTNFWDPDRASHELNYRETERTSFISQKGRRKGKKAQKQGHCAERTKLRHQFLHPDEHDEDYVTGRWPHFKSDRSRGRF